jgi:hypothetical protein
VSLQQLCEIYQAYDRFSISHPQLLGDGYDAISFKTQHPSAYPLALQLSHDTMGCRIKCLTDGCARSFLELRYTPERGFGVFATQSVTASRDRARRTTAYDGVYHPGTDGYEGERQLQTAVRGGSAGHAYANDCSHIMALNSYGALNSKPLLPTDEECFFGGFFNTNAGIAGATAKVVANCVKVSDDACSCCCGEKHPQYAMVFDLIANVDPEEEVYYYYKANNFGESLPQ